MAMKSIILITVLVVVLVAAQAEAQLLPPLPINVPGPPINVPGPITALFNISGIVSCSVNGSVNGTTPAPPFPNALVQLVIGGRPIASAVTNASGAFSIILTPVQVISGLLGLISSNSNIVVSTPLANCNASLPLNGTLQAPLQLVRTTIVGGLGTVTDLVAGVLELVN